MELEFRILAWMGCLLTTEDAPNLEVAVATRILALREDMELLVGSPPLEPLVALVEEEAEEEEAAEPAWLMMVS